MAELLTKEQLAEIERVAAYDDTTWLAALLAHCRALEARVDSLNTLGEEMLTRLESLIGIGQKADHGWYYVVGRVEARLREVEAERGVLAGMVANFHKEHRDALVEQFRQRAVDAIGGLPPADESCETFDIEQVIKTLQSLPAISEQEEQKNSGR